MYFPSSYFIIDNKISYKNTAHINTIETKPT